jgi:hypothetical protein
VTFYSLNAANQALENPYLTQQTFTFVPWNKVFRRGIIRGIPLNISMDELVQVLIKTSP